MLGQIGVILSVLRGQRPMALMMASIIVAILFALLFPTSLNAATERYDYDANGRLIRWIDGSGKATDYVYDPAGNLLEVRAAGTAIAPTITSVAPSTLRRGMAQDIVVSGSNLSGARLTVPDAELTATGFTASATQASFHLQVGSGALLGPNGFSLANASGTATFDISIDPTLPTLSVAPTPLAVPPDGVARNFKVRLSNADHYAHSITLASADASIATVSPASVTIPAGQTEATASITGLKAGTTAIRLSSSDLGATALPVFVTGEFAGLNTSHASLLGVVLEAPVQPPAGRRVEPIVSPLLGLERGPVIEGVSPGTLAQATGPTDVVIHGRELSGVTGVQIQPSDGLALGAVTVAPDGSRVTVPITVAADAPTTLRQLKLSGAGAPYLPAHPRADRLLVTLPQPEILSLDPIVALPGDNLTLTVRGRNLQGASAVVVTPGTHVTVGASPSVNADGSVLTVGVSISILAPPGQRVVQVSTPGGDTGATASSANAFRIVNEVQGAVTPVAAALLGVLKQSEPVQNQTPFTLQANPLGVVTGAVVTGLSPRVGSVGEGVTLTVSGHEMSGVTHVEFAPTDGLTIGAPSVAADGRSLSLGVAIDAGAARTPRKVLVKAGTSTLPVSSADASVFNVVAPLPQIQSVTPLQFVAGDAPAMLTVRGSNLQGAEGVIIQPADQMTVSVPPAVNANGTELTVNVAASAGAALGNRIVVVRTPAGETMATATASNTVAVVSNPGATYTPVAAPLLGLVKESAVPPATQDIPVQSPQLGVILQTDTPPMGLTLDQRAPLLGLSVGPVATGMQAPYLTPGAIGELVITGSGLETVSSAQVEGPAGISPTTLNVDATGRGLRLGISADAAAAAGVRRIKLLDAASQVVPFANPAGALFDVAVGVPRIDSIDPILADQGDTVTLLVRGANLQGGRVVIEPLEGIQVGTGTSVNAAGTELTVGLALSGTAVVGARVIRVETAGGITPVEASPSNTFTLYPKP